MRGKPLNPDIKEACRCFCLKGGTIRDAAKKFGVSESTLFQTSAREGWIQSKRNIEQRNKSLELQVSGKVVEKMAEKASSLVSEHLEKMIKGSTGLRDMLLTNLTENTSLPPILKTDDFESSVRSLQRLDQLSRLSMGLPSSHEAHTVTGSIDVNQRVLSIIASVRGNQDELPMPDDKSLELLAKRLADESKS